MKLREVMFRLVFVFPSMGRGGCACLVPFSIQGLICLVPCPFHEGGYVYGAGIFREWVFWGLVHQRGYTRSMYTQPLGEWDLGYRPPSPSTGHNNTYRWQASSTHSTGMLSCFVCVFLHFCTSNCNPENSFHPSRPVLTTVSYSFSIQQIISQQRFFAIASCRNLFRSDLLTINTSCLPIF